MNAAQQHLTAISWVAGDDTGASSMTIWSVMMGAEPQGRYGSAGAWPADPDDFGRCYRLLTLIPEWRGRLGEVATRHPGAWTGLVEAWDELTALWEEEAGAGLDRAQLRGKSAPRLYRRMKQAQAKYETRRSA
jgi:hypothetical protein